MIGPWTSIRKVQSNGKDLVVFNLPVELEEVLPVAGKAFHAVACLALVVGLMVSGIIPNVQAALIGCLLMGVFGCVNLNSAYRAIDWKTIVLIVGMLPFSIALERTGGVEMAADGLMALVGGAGNHAVLATLFAITSILGMFISNTATAVLDGPGRRDARRGHARLALSVRDDRRAGRFDGIHDSGFVAREHAGGDAGQLHIWRFCEGWRAVQLDCAGRERDTRTLAAATLGKRRLLPISERNSSMNQTSAAPKTAMQRFLDVVERVGNKVPHPAVIFLILIIIVVALSHILYLMGTSVTAQVIEPVLKRSKAKRPISTSTTLTPIPKSYSRLTISKKRRFPSRAC